nr:unnamed protein product [uncultured bacterium]
MKSLDSLSTSDLESTWNNIQKYQAMRKERDRVARELMRRESKKFLGENEKETVCEFLSRKFDEESPMDFYNAIFRNYLDIPDEFNKGAYTGIVTEKVKLENEKDKIRRYSITDGLVELKTLIETSDNFCFMSPISYCGKRATQENARFLFGFAIDLDSIVYKDDVPIGVYDLVYQIMNEVLPKPTYLVSSGYGVHLYYIFDEPIPLYRNNVRLLKSVRKKLIKKIWNPYVTDDYSDKKIQWESLWQGFRVVGTKTKSGNICRAFRVGNAETVSLEYICSFLYDNEKEFIKNFKFMHKYSYSELKKMWPDWTARHFDKNGKPKKNPIKKYWTCKPELYYWYLNRLEKEVVPGHRYHSLMCLAGYALKSGIAYDQFEKDCWGLFEIYESKTEQDENHWKEKDVESALECYKAKTLKNLSIEAISAYAGIPIERNKRNYRKQEQHLKIARATRDIIHENWREGNGRKPKKEIVEEWRKHNPNGKPKECIQQTGLSKNTVYKWWDGGSDVAAKPILPKEPKMTDEQLIQMFITDIMQGLSAEEITDKVVNAVDPQSSDEERDRVKALIASTQKSMENILNLVKK